jgi:Fic family protein
MTRQYKAGKFVTQQAGSSSAYKAFIPSSLKDIVLGLTPQLQTLIERASRAIGRLDGTTLLLPDPSLFIYMYARQEAVLSSQIEGTQSTLSDLLLFESGEASLASDADVQTVHNYQAAMQYGLERLQSGFPLSLRLLREIHTILIRDTRGSNKRPGEFRTSQNWIGGTRPGNAMFVPPPPHEMHVALADLESFLNDGPPLPLLVRAGIAHGQFETIHPFLDGNGRIGRLLITFMLCADGALSQPLLYLSLYLKQHRSTYYDMLQNIRTNGTWEPWLQFYLEGVEAVATQATQTTRRLVALFESDREQLHRMGGRSATLLKVHELLKRKAVASISEVAASVGISFPTAATALRVMCEREIIREVTQRRRDRIFVYQGYLDILSDGVANS